LQNANARRVLGHDNGPIRGMESIGSALKRMTPELVVSKQKLRQAEGSCMVRLKREEGKQNVGFSSRPFVLCGLPVRKPPAGEMLYERRNGDFVLQITGHPNFSKGALQMRFIQRGCALMYSSTVLGTRSFIPPFYVSAFRHATSRGSAWRKRSQWEIVIASIAVRQIGRDIQVRAHPGSQAAPDGWERWLHLIGPFGH